MNAPATSQADDGDLLYGVPAIASHLGIGVKQCRHRIDAKAIPAFKIGGTICARKSSLKEWLDKLEGRTDG